MANYQNDQYHIVLLLWTIKGLEIVRNNVKYIKITTFDQTFLIKKYKIFSKFLSLERVFCQKNISLPATRVWYCSCL